MSTNFIYVLLGWLLIIAANSFFGMIAALYLAPLVGPLAVFVAVPVGFAAGYFIAWFWHRKLGVDIEWWHK